MLYELILINEIEQRAKIIFLSVMTAEKTAWSAGINYILKNIKLETIILNSNNILVSILLKIKHLKNLTDSNLWKNI